MGFKDADWAYSLKLPTSQKVILVAIAHATDDSTHQTYVSQKTLAEMVGMSVATVNASVRVLDQVGIISRQRRSGAGGYRTTDIITINTAYVDQANVGETNVGDTYIGETDDLHQTDARPTSTSLIAEEINQIDQPEDQPDLSLDALAAVEPDLDQLFASGWEHWSKKVDRKDAVAKFKIVARKHFKGREQELVDAIIAHGQAHAAYTPRQFIPGLAVWLNKERWNNPLPEAPEPERNSMTRGQKNLAYVQQLAAEEAARSRGIAS